MIDEKRDLPIPSTLRESGDRIDSIKKRVLTVKEGAAALGLETPEKYINDEHYWYLVMKSFHETNNILRKAVPEEELRRSTSMQIAISQANEVAEIEERAQIDGLTGATNRKGLDNFVENLRSRGIKAGIIMLDGDHFKTYNDEHGHPEGDKVLRGVVKVAKKNVRPTDMVARYGGEEFVVVMPGLDDQEKVSDTAEKIRIAIQQEGSITISLGATTLKPQDEKIKDVYKRVDTNLYSAKSNGRNVVYNDGGKYIPSSEQPISTMTGEANG